jgi:hypothetical protein
MYSDAIRKSMGEPEPEWETSWGNTGVQSQSFAHVMKDRALHGVVIASKIIH